MIVSDNVNMLKAIDRRVSEEYMLRQLAEECAELAQAALKLIRAVNHETPMSELEARLHFIEEMADVSVMWDWAYWCFFDQTDALFCDDTQRNKLDRMADRILRAKGGASDE